jgi:predicted ATPase
VALDRLIVRPVLVGRAAHCVELDACQDQAQAGRGQLVLIHGGAGVGKSRLLQALPARAAQPGACVVQGASSETGRNLPFGPFIERGKEFLAGRLVAPELRSGRPVWLIGRMLDEGQDVLNDAQEDEILRAIRAVGTRSSPANWP